MVWGVGRQADELQPALPKGFMVLRTPLGASWLNVTESMQRILKWRALEEDYPK